jgi:hypothetical protein
MVRALMAKYGSYVYNKFPLHWNGQHRNTRFLTDDILHYKILFISSTMNMEAEMSIMFYQTTQHHIPESSYLYLSPTSSIIVTDRMHFVLSHKTDSKYFLPNLDIKNKFWCYISLLLYKQTALIYLALFFCLPYFHNFNHHSFQQKKDMLQIVILTYQILDKISVVP